MGKLYSDKTNNFAAPTNNSHQHQQQDFGLSR